MGEEVGNIVSAHIFKFRGGRGAEAEGAGGGGDSVREKIRNGGCEDGEPGPVAEGARGSQNAKKGRTREGEKKRLGGRLLTRAVTCGMRAEIGSHRGWIKGGRELTPNGVVSRAGNGKKGGKPEPTRRPLTNSPPDLVCWQDLRKDGRVKETSSRTSIVANWGGGKASRGTKKKKEKAHESVASPTTREKLLLKGGRGRGRKRTVLGK